MALWITEYRNMAAIGQLQPFPSDYGLGGAGSSVITTQVVSSGAGVSTFNLSTATQMIRIAASANGWVLNSASSSSTSIVTSTNAPFSPPNTIEYRGVVAGSRLTALST